MHLKFRFTFAGNDYVLRSCISSVELKRRNINSPTLRESALQSSFRGRLIADDSIPHPIKSVQTKTRRQYRQKLDGRSVRRGLPYRAIIEDTPLKTLVVQRRGRNNGPQLYVKKDRLPELKSSNIVERNDRKNEASIIVIETTSRVPNQ